MEFRDFLFSELGINKSSGSGQTPATTTSTETTQTESDSGGSFRDFLFNQLGVSKPATQTTVSDILAEPATPNYSPAVQRLINQQKQIEQSAGWNENPNKRDKRAVKGWEELQRQIEAELYAPPKPNLTPAESGASGYVVGASPATPPTTPQPTQTEVTPTGEPRKTPIDEYGLDWFNNVYAYGKQIAEGKGLKAGTEEYDNAILEHINSNIQWTANDLGTVPIFATAEDLPHGAYAAMGKDIRRASGSDKEELRAEREALRQELGIPTFGERIGNIFTAAGTGLGASYTDAERALFASGQGRRTAETEEEIASIRQWLDIERSARAADVEQYGEDYASTVHDPTIADLERRLAAFEQVIPAQEGATEATAEIADQLQQKSIEATKKAKTDLNGFERFLVDMGVNGIQMASDAAINLALGTPGSLAPLFARSFGSGTQTARQDGADINQQLLYGAAVASVEALTEKMFDGLAGVYGKGTCDNLSYLIIDKIAKESDPVVKKALLIFLGAAGESAEEAISGRLDPWLSSIYDKGEAIKQTYGSGWENYLNSWAEDGYSMLVGFAMGFAGSTVGANGQYNEYLDWQGNNGVTSTSTSPTAPLAEAQDILIEGTKSGQRSAKNDNSDAVIEALTQQNTDNAVAFSTVSGYNEENADTGVDTNGTEAGLGGEAGAGVPRVGETNTVGSSEGQNGSTDSQLVGERDVISPETLQTLDNSLKAKNPKKGIVNVGLQNSTDSAFYSSSLQAAKDADPAHGNYVSFKDAAEIQEIIDNGGKALISPDGSTGLIVKADGDVVAAFRNQQTGKKGSLPEMLVAAIQNGGTKLDCYGIDLVNSYAKAGFVPVARVVFNPEIAMEYDGWTQEQIDEYRSREGHDPDVIFMMHNGQTAQQVAENYGDVDFISWDDLDALPTYDGENGYDEAMAYRDGLVEQQKSTSTDVNSPTKAGEITSTNVKNGIVPRNSTAADVNNSTVTKETHGAKRSQTESNTLQGVANVMGGEQESLYYIPTSERQTLMAAAARVQQDIGGEMTSLMEKDMWTAEDVDTAMSIYGILQADGVRNHDFSAAEAWGRVIQPRGTSNAQALQAFAKWTRSGDAVVSDAIQSLQDADIPQELREHIYESLYDFAKRYDSIMPDKNGNLDLGALRNLIKDISDLRKTGTFVKKNFAKVLDKITDSQWLKEYALRQMMAVPSDYTNKATLAQQAKTWQVNSQLTRLGTFLRNIGGNVLFGIQDTFAQDSFGFALDYLISKKTGRREVALEKSWLSSKARKGARDSMLKSILEVAGDVDMTGDATRYGLTSSRTYKMTGNKFSQFMSRWEQLLGYSLTTSDRTSRGQIESSIIESLQRANNGKMSMEDMQAIAHEIASYRLFQNDGIATGVSRGIHDAFNAIGFGGQLDRTGRHGGFGVGDLLNAYPGVPANLAVKALEYSPANIVRGGINLIKILSDYHNGVDVKAGSQAKAVLDIARGMSGVPAIVLLASLFRSGAAKNADDEDDLDVKSQQAAEGKTGVQLNLSASKRLLEGKSGEWQDGDDIMSIGWAEPLNAFMAIASMVADSDEDVTVGSFAKDYLRGTIQSILDMPVMSNIANIRDTFRYSNEETIEGKVGESAMRFAGDAVSGMLPAPFFSQLAKETDDTYRQTKGNTAFESVVNGIMANIPGLRQQLNPVLDNFGNEKKYTGSGLQRFMNTYVLPGAINEVSQSEIGSMVEDLYEATGDPAAYPDRKAPTSLRFGSDSYKLTVEEQNEYQKKVGENIASLLESATHGAQFNSLSDEDKVGALNEIYKYAEHLAKKEYAESHGIDYDGGEYKKFDDLKDPAEGIVLNKEWKDATKTEDFTAQDALLSRIVGLEDSNPDIYEMILGTDDSLDNMIDASQLEKPINAEDFDYLHKWGTQFKKWDTEVSKSGVDNRDYNRIDALTDFAEPYLTTEDGELNEDAVAVFNGYFSHSDELIDAKHHDIDSKTWYIFRDKYLALDNTEGLSNTERHNQFNNFVDDSDLLTDEQKEFIKGQMIYWTSRPVSETVYDKMATSSRYTVDTSNALRWATEMGDLEPLPGKTSVSNNQKADIIFKDKTVSDLDKAQAIIAGNVRPTMKYFAGWLRSSNLSQSQIDKIWSDCISLGWWGAKNKSPKKK